MHFILTILLSAVFIIDESFGTRVVSGEEAEITDYPHQVSVKKWGIHVCGGSIIDSKHILTAAHCVGNNIPSGDLSITAGSSLLKEGGTTVKISAIKCHPDYNENSTTWDNDLCVLKLEKPLEFSEKISAIQLPSHKEDVPPKMEAIATGWGKLSECGKQPARLHKAAFPTLSPKICRMVYGNQVTESMICTGFPRSGSIGDSGGPLVLNGKLIGITSWGEGCGVQNRPGVFTRVSYFVKFIRSQMKD